MRRNVYDVGIEIKWPRESDWDLLEYTVLARDAEEAIQKGKKLAATSFFDDGDYDPPKKVKVEKVRLASVTFHGIVDA